MKKRDNIMDYGFFIDVDRCSGCQACIVACMDQNDIEIGEDQPWRKVMQVEDKELPKKITFISLACMHCEDAPCVKACPTGSISKRADLNSVDVNQDLCIGCHSCSIACPFGIPRFGTDGKMQKCDMCIERVKDGREPACVRVCPTEALKFGPVNELMEEQENKTGKKIVDSIRSIVEGSKVVGKIGK